MREGLASASEVTVVIALGTHQGMSDEHLGRHLGYNLGEACVVAGCHDVHFLTKTLPNVAAEMALSVLA